MNDLSLGCRVAHDRVDHPAEVQHLLEAQSDGEVDPDGDRAVDQHLAPEGGVQEIDGRRNRRRSSPFPPFAFPPPRTVEHGPVAGFRCCSLGYASQQLPALQPLPQSSFYVHQRVVRGRQDTWKAKRRELHTHFNRCARKQDTGFATSDCGQDCRERLVAGLPEMRSGGGLRWKFRCCDIGEIRRVLVLSRTRQIQLQFDVTRITLHDGLIITGQSSFPINGVLRTVANTALAMDADGYRIVEAASMYGTDNRLPEPTDPWPGLTYASESRLEIWREKTEMGTSYWNGRTVIRQIGNLAAEPF